MSSAIAQREAPATDAWKSQERDRSLVQCIALTLTLRP